MWKKVVLACGIGTAAIVVREGWIRKDILFSSSSVPLPVTTNPPARRPTREEIEAQGGVRILAIDGGGTRGRVAARTLTALEAKLQTRPGHEQTRLCDTFDLVCGTSAGGILAVALSGVGLSPQDCLKLSDAMSSKVFKNISVSSIVWNGSRYGHRVGVLESVFKQVLGANADKPLTQFRPYVGVVASSPHRTSGPFVIGSWSESVPGIDCKISALQALRATSAANSYFPGIKVGSYELRDGGVGHNNPTDLAIQQAKEIWGEDVPIKCVVSVGTGLPIAVSPQGWWSQLKSVLYHVIDATTESEQVHRRMESNSELYGKYFRLNPTILDVSLDDSATEVLEGLDRQTGDYLGSRGIQEKLTLVSSMLTIPTWYTPRPEQTAPIRTSYLAHSAPILEYVQRASSIRMTYLYSGHSFLGLDPRVTAFDQETIAKHLNSKSFWVQYFQKGGSIELILPDPEIAEAAFGMLECQPESKPAKIKDIKDLQEKIQRTANTLIASYHIAVAGGNESARLRIIYSAKPPNYSLYLLDEDQALVSVFEEVWGDQIMSPVTVFDLATGDERSAHVSRTFEKDFNHLATNGKVVFDSHPALK